MKIISSVLMGGLLLLALAGVGAIAGSPDAFAVDLNIDLIPDRDPGFNPVPERFDRDLGHGEFHDDLEGEHEEFHDELRHGEFHRDLRERHDDFHIQV